MKSSAKKVELASVDNLFTTEQERQEADEERVVRIPLTQLHYFKGYPAMQTEVPFTGQPYRFKDDDPKMQETLDSVKKRGVRAPGLVRPDPDGGYEIISGHRRHRASELAGLEDMPVIIRDMTDEEAVIPRSVCHLFTVLSAPNKGLGLSQQAKHKQVLFRECGYTPYACYGISLTTTTAAQPQFGKPQANFFKRKTP